MAIVRYTASADNTITNAFKEDLSTRGTGSNMGTSDTLEVFGIYAQESSASAELSRALIKFPTTTINSDRTATTIPASGSVNFFLKMYNVAHSETLPIDYKLTVARITNDWQEGYGLDMDNYTDLTLDATGSNWINANGNSATATATVTVANEGFIEDGDTITLIATDGTTVVATAHATNNTSTAATTAVTFSHNGANTTAQAALIATAINYSSYFSATSDGPVVTITQATAGLGGNTTVTCVDGGGAGPWFTKTNFTGGSGKWATVGGDFVTASNSGMDFVDVSFSDGDEDIEVDITSIVEGWITTGNTNYGLMVKLSSSYETYYSSSTGANSGSLLHNTDGAQRSYYTKKFSARGTEFFFKRPAIEARWDDSRRDNRGDFYVSSSMVPAADNLNTLYMYNYVRGKLQDIAGASTQIPVLNLYYSSGSVPEGSARGFLNSSNSAVTFLSASRVSTGIYSVSFAATSSVVSTTYPYLVDVWTYSGSQIHTGSAITPKTYKFFRAESKFKVCSFCFKYERFL